MKKMSIKNILDNEKTAKIAMIIGTVAIGIIFLSSFIDFPGMSSGVDIDKYRTDLEEKLLYVVTQIEGVGNAKIFLTMENEGESVYLQNSDTKTKNITPSVRGVVVVCDGGDDPLIVSRVLSAVTRSLDIPSNKVCVTKLSN